MAARKSTKKIGRKIMAAGTNTSATKDTTSSVTTTMECKSMDAFGSTRCTTWTRSEATGSPPRRGGSTPITKEGETRIVEQWPQFRLAYACGRKARLDLANGDMFAALRGASSPPSDSNGMISVALGSVLEHTSAVNLGWTQSPESHKTIPAVTVAQSR